MRNVTGTPFYVLRQRTARRKAEAMNLTRVFGTEKPMESVMKTVLGKLVRHLAAPLVVWLLAAGVEQEMIDQILMALVTLATITWSVLPLLLDAKAAKLK